MARGNFAVCGEKKESMSLEEQLGPGLESFGLPRDHKARTEVFVSVVKGYIDSGKNRQLNIMVIGEAGQGKSTLINALVGSEVAKEGDRFIPGTVQIQEYRINQNGVDIAIWDTPGFGIGSPEEDAKTVEEMKVRGCRNVDLALFCVRMDTMRFPTRVHSDTILKLNEVFGRGFWKNCLFVLTFANNVQEFCPEGVEMVGYFSQRCDALEEQIRGALCKHAKLTDNELMTVRAIPVGSYKKGLFRKNPWALPDREDWFIMFWIECTEHMEKSALSALLRANYHRLEACDALETSMGPPPQFDAHDRLLQATTEELSEIRLELDTEETGHVIDNVGASPPQTRVNRERVTGRTMSNPSNPPIQSPQPVTDVSSSLGGRPIDVEKGIHDREVPLYETLRKQLEDKDSSFFDYVATFVKERGKSFPLFGHLKGLVEGLKAYLTSGKKKID